MAEEKKIFSAGPVSINSLLVLFILATTLFAVSQFTNWLRPVKALFLDIVAPAYGVANVVENLSNMSEAFFITKEQVLRQNKQLIDENLLLNRRAQKVASLEVENTRLRSLLSASANLQEFVIMAELVGSIANTESQRRLINRGASDKLKIGQVVLDDKGVIGQVAVVGENYSEIILISDREHALPVESLRSGERMIASGAGEYNALNLLNVPVTFDVIVGDTLVSSGLGGRFPKGYPVGVVTSVSQNTSTPFLQITVLPSAGLRTSRQFLLLFEQDPINTSPVN